MPLISIIIPIYNGEKTIRETILSVLNQTFTDIEVLVINDGSTDSTLETISNITDPRLKVVSFPNAGLSASRNRGIKLASGEFISFIDADDLWTPDKLESQFNALNKTPETGVAYSWTNWIDESGQIIYGGGNHLFSGDVYTHLFLGDFIEGGSNVLIRRSALDEIGGFNETIQYSEDWEMWLRLATKYEFVSVPKPQILYRISSGSMSSNVLGMEAASLAIIQQAIAQSPQPIEHLKSHCLANRYKYLIYKALDSYPIRKNGLIAIKFLWKILQNDPNIIKKRVFWKILLKITVVITLPPQKSQQLFNQNSQPFDIQSLLMQIQLNPNLL
jgi:glycosyltransferase involved in cell wall biosynthesis